MNIFYIELNAAIVYRATDIKYSPPRGYQQIS